MDLSLRLTFLLGIASADRVMFTLLLNAEKCLGNFAPNNTLVIGHYHVTRIPNQSVDLLVHDQARQVLARTLDVDKGAFSFILEKPQVYQVCFHSKGDRTPRSATHLVNLTVLTGFEAVQKRELDEVAKLKPLESKLSLLEMIARSILDDQQRMRVREIRMRNTNESTLSRVFYLGLFNVTWLTLTSMCEVLYLKKYFKSKKLIE